MSDYKWKRQNTVYIGLNLFKTTDADILAFVEKQKSKQGFIKAAIRYYIANGCPEITKEEADDE